MTATVLPTKDNVPRNLAPNEIGLLVKTVRSQRRWTQEVLADLSGLQTRTIQRVERGKPSSIDTRRALARAFQLDDIDYFDSLVVFPPADDLQKQKELFDREHILLDVQVVDGRQIMTLMLDAPDFRALSAGSMSDLPPAAQDAFARIVDYVRECLDIFDVASRSEILSYGDELDGHIFALREAGFCLCAAFRCVKLAATGAEKPTPLPCQITYLLASPKDQFPTKVAVSREVSGGL
jgi:transcriptional regulator with XRE-family HTH domain